MSRPENNLSNDARITKAEEILRFIAESPTGRTLREIQVWLIRKNFNRDWTPSDRGYYCTNLTGYASMCAGKGLLQKYGERRMVNEDGKRRVKWVVTKPIVGPWYVGTVCDGRRDANDMHRDYRQCYNSSETAEERRQMIETSNNPARLLQNWVKNGYGYASMYDGRKRLSPKEFKELTRIIVARGK